MQPLLSLYRWAVWLFHIAVCGPLIVLAVLISPKRLGFRVTSAVVRSAFFLTGIQVRGVGRDCLDWSRAYVFMGNHQNMLDPFAMILAIKCHVIVIEKVENLKLPVYGWFTRAWGNIPIQREDAENAREGISLAAERLRSGSSIGIMPEGTRSKDGSVGPFKKGGFHMAIDAGADIVPFTINGAYDRLPRGGWQIFPGTIEIVFGDPIPTAGLGKADLEPLMARVRTAVLANFTGPKAREVLEEAVA